MGPARILVVDDDPGLRELMGQALALEGLEVTAVESATAGLAHLREHPVDVVLLDRILADEDGLDVLVRIRADPEIGLVPVILVTGLDDVGATVEGLDRGADDYVTKPFAPDELAARVRAQLRGHRAWVDRMTSVVAHRRAVLAGAAAAAGREVDASAAAAALGDELVGESDVAGVVVLEVAPGARRELLARTGTDGLRLLGLAGATDDLDAIARGLPDGPRRIALPDHIVAAAPVRDGPRTLGVVVVTGSTAARFGAADDLLALTIDAAAVTAGVLAEPLRRSADRAESLAEVRALLARPAFHPVFQPIVDLATGAVVGHEALTRFDDGHDPEELFLRASRLGVGRELEHATLRLAIERSSRQPRDTWLALNVSPSLVLATTELGEILRSADRNDIVLEISELEPVRDYDALLRAIAALGATVQISVDDAGSGFASLAHILALGARYVKLDKTWIHGIDVDPAKRALVAGLQSFADETGASLIAEGIETPAQRRTVEQLGIAYGQGWLLGVPSEL